MALSTAARGAAPTKAAAAARASAAAPPSKSARPAPAASTGLPRYLQRRCACESCSTCGPGEAAVLQRRAAPGAAGPAAHTAGAAQGPPALGPGQALPTSVRQHLEPLFGRSLAPVRVHTGPQAASATRALGAQAFTMGPHIAFAAGHFVPHTPAGLHLLAHEVAHTVQQSSALASPMRRPLVVGPPGGLHEQEADAAADRVLHGQPVTALSPVGGALLQTQAVADAAAADPDAGASRAEEPPSLEGGVSTYDPGPIGMDGRPSIASPMAGAEAAPPPGPDAIGWFGDLMSSDAAFMAHQMRARVGAAPTLRDGEEMLGRWLDEFEATIDRTALSLSDESGVSELRTNRMIWVDRARRVLPAARGALLDLELEHIRFEREFLSRGELVIAGMLDMSSERVESEARRYGLIQTGHTRTRMVHDGLARSRETEVTFTYSMNSSVGSVGLATAAGVLADRAQVVVQQVEAFWEAVIPDALAMVEPDPATYDAAQRPVDEARQAYDRLRAEKEAEYPILASFTALPSENALYPLRRVVATLRSLARGPGSGNAETLFTETAEKRSNIARTGQALVDEDLVLWELQPALAATQGAMGLTDGSWQQRWVREAAARYTSRRSIVDLALGALALGLGLIAAIPSGGSSLVAAGTFVAGLGAAGLSGYFAVDHLRQYMLDSAASGTDFDRARAISSADPSLFWLALDIVGAVADIHGAMSAFRALSGAVRETLALRAAGPEVEAAIEAAARRAEDMHPGLGDRVRQGLRREVGREGRNVDAAIREWEAGMNSESRAFLVDHPETLLRYTEMPPPVRQALTFCASVCVIPSATAGQSAELERLLGLWGDGDMTRLRQYLHANADQLDTALARLRGAEDWRAVDHAILEEARGASFAPSENPFAGLTEAEIDAALDDMFSPDLAGGARPTINGHRVPLRARTRLDIQSIERLAGETARAALARVRRVIGVRLDEIGPVRQCWERARAQVLARTELTASNYAELYNRVRRIFWSEVAADPHAAAFFRNAGFGFHGADGSAPLLNTGADVSVTEIRVSLDHIVEKAIGENWRRALDADNLRMEFAMPNTYREIIQARHPELRLLGAEP